MTNSETYFERAAECLCSARAAQTGREREGYLELADGWRLLAEQARALEEASGSDAGGSPAAQECARAGKSGSLAET